MKLRKNELLKATVGASEHHHEIIEGKTVFFTAGETKDLRKNSRNLKFWDGCNWRTETITDIEIVEYVDAEEQPEQPDPAYSSLWNIIVSGQSVELISSNMSRSLTPFWEVIL